MRISDWSSDVCSSDLDGHFYADAQVGAATVHFLIDTGATAVALSRADAQRAGISPRAGEFTGTARPANGTVPLKPVTNDRIRIGPPGARHAAAAVLDRRQEAPHVGKEYVHTCRARSAQYHLNNK